MSSKLLPLMLSCVLSVCCAVPVLGEDAAPPPMASKGTLSEVYTDLAVALRKNDVAALERMLADDFVLVDHEGKVDNKASLLQAIKDGIVTVRTFDLGTGKMKEWDSAGIAQGPLQMHVTYGRAKPVEIDGRFAVTAVFAKSGGQWQLSTAQMTSIKPRQ